MKTKLITLLSLLIASLSLFLVPASATVKAGSVCKKAGITSVVASKTYTCIKSGKKLAWSKGIGVTAPIPKAPTSFDDLVQNYEGITYTAWSKSRTKIITSTKTDFNFKLVLGPSSVLTNKNPIDAINLVSRLYSGYAKSVELYF